MPSAKKTPKLLQGYQPYLTVEQCRKQIALAGDSIDPKVVFLRWRKAGLTRGYKTLPFQHYVVKTLKAAQSRIAKASKKNKKAV